MLHFNGSLQSDVIRAVYISHGRQSRTSLYTRGPYIAHQSVLERRGNEPGLSHARNVFSQKHLVQCREMNYNLKSTLTTDGQEQS